MKHVDVFRLVFKSPHQFFGGIEERGECNQLVSWVGELYFELHRGTYTSQAQVYICFVPVDKELFPALSWFDPCVVFVQAKQANRKCEVLLHDVEFLAAIARYESLYVLFESCISAYDCILRGKVVLRYPSKHTLERNCCDYGSFYFWINFMMFYLEVQSERYQTLPCFTQLLVIVLLVGVCGCHGAFQG